MHSAITYAMSVHKGTVGIARFVACSAVMQSIPRSNAAYAWAIHNDSLHITCTISHNLAFFFGYMHPVPMVPNTYIHTSANWYGCSEKASTAAQHHILSVSDTAVSSMHRTQQTTDYAILQATELPPDRAVAVRGLVHCNSVTV